MTRIEREQMIERYVQGMMPSSEEERFLIEVASDPELRYELKASQVIDSAIRKDRSRGVIPTGKMRANIALLAAPLDLSPADPRDSAIPTPGSWFSRWTVGAGGFVALVIAGGLLFNGDPIGNRNDLPAPAEQVISTQQEDLSSVPEVTDVAEPIPAEMISVEPKRSPRQTTGSQIDRTAPTRTATGTSARTPSASDDVEHSSVPSVVSSPSQPPTQPVTSPGVLDTDTANVIDDGVDASDTTNSGSPQMNVQIDSSNPPN